MTLMPPYRERSATGLGMTGYDGGGLVKFSNAGFTLRTYFGVKEIETYVSDD